MLTDFADYPPHFWLERQEQFVVCGSERAVAQARSTGFRDHQIYATSGMILHPKFYQEVTVDRAAERQRLGLDPELPTGLVMFGGQGSSVMVKIARKLEAAKQSLQLILICGHNERLAAMLRGLRGKVPKYVEGFTTEVPYYMRLADFFIGKPGPGSISEALAMKLPVIVERNARTLPAGTLQRGLGPRKAGRVGACATLAESRPRSKSFLIPPISPASVTTPLPSTIGRFLRFRVF